jgi:hypothetical protein
VDFSLGLRTSSGGCFDEGGVSGVVFLLLVLLLVLPIPYSNSLAFLRCLLHSPGLRLLSPVPLLQRFKLGRLRGSIFLPLSGPRVGLSVVSASEFMRGVQPSLC